MLYRYGGDLFYALSISLGEARTKGIDISEVCTHLNAKCHTIIKDLIQEDAASPHNIESLNVEQIIKKIDPEQYVYKQGLLQLKQQTQIQ